MHLLTVIGLSPDGSSTVHIYTQTVHRTTQLTTLVGRLSGIRTQSGQTKINDKLTRKNYRLIGKNIAIIQRFQSKLLRATVNAPCYITNAMIHSDLGIPAVQDVIHDRNNKHRAKLWSHPNPLLQKYQGAISHGN